MRVSNPITDYIPASLLTTQGDMLYRDATGPARLPVGSNYTELSVITDVPTWAANALGKLRANAGGLYVGLAGTPQRLDITDQNDMLINDGTDLLWGDIPPAQWPWLDLTWTFSVLPFAGTAANPTNMNDGNVANVTTFNNINDTAWCYFFTPFTARKWRFYGHANQNGDGDYKLQYLDIHTFTWTDWVTGIPTRGASWSTVATETPVVCMGLQMVSTTQDSLTGANIVGELEIYY